MKHLSQDSLQSGDHNEISFDSRGAFKSTNYGSSSLGEEDTYPALSVAPGHMRAHNPLGIVSRAQFASRALQIIQGQPGLPLDRASFSTYSSGDYTGTSFSTIGDSDPFSDTMTVTNGQDSFDADALLEPDLYGYTADEGRPVVNLGQPFTLGMSFMARKLSGLTTGSEAVPGCSDEPFNTGRVQAQSGLDEHYSSPLRSSPSEIMDHTIQPGVPAQAEAGFYKLLSSDPYQPHAPVMPNDLPFNGTFPGVDSGWHYPTDM